MGIISMIRCKPRAMRLWKDKIKMERSRRDLAKVVICHFGGVKLCVRPAQRQILEKLGSEIACYLYLDHSIRYHHIPSSQPRSTNYACHCCCCCINATTPQAAHLLRRTEYRTREYGIYIYRRNKKKQETQAARLSGKF